MNQHPCKRCQQPIDISGADERLLLMITRYGLVCTPCSEDQVRRAKITAGLTRWDRLVPASLRTPDDGRSLAASAIAADLDRALGGSLILYLVGPCRSGKTRAAYHALRQPMIEGRSVEAISLAELATTLPLRSGEYLAELVERLQCVQLLLIDDLDKAIFSPRFAQLLYCIINGRILAQRITIMTSNIGIIPLQNLIAETCPAWAEPIVSRIDENARTWVIE